MKKIQNFLPVCFAFFGLFFFSDFICLGQPGMVFDFQKISDTEGNFSGYLDNSDAFNRGANIGDLDNDGIDDLAVGAFWDDDGGTDKGAVWILFLNEDRTVKSHQKISDTQGNFTGFITLNGAFGYSVAGIGDLNGDGVEDIVVGAPYASNNGGGEIWVLFLNTDGTVASYIYINEGANGFYGNLDPGDFFGIQISNIGDFDKDGVVDIAVGASGDSDGGGSKTGALWLLFLNTNGKVKAYQKISAVYGGFTGTLEGEDRFGRTCTNIGDLDSDGTDDLVVSSLTDDDGGFNKGALWTLFMNPDGTVNSYKKISDTQGNFSGVLDENDQLGQASDALGDIDGDGIMDIIVSAHNDDDGGGDKGAAYVLFLNQEGIVKNYQKISNTSGNFAGSLDPGDTFGSEISVLGDLNNDGFIEIAVGASWDDDGGTDRGAVYILSIEVIQSPTIKVDIHTFLEGPYTGTIMAPLLNLLGHLPLAQPYNTPPWNYSGVEAVTAIPNTNVVDWALVELRESTGSAGTATPDSIVGRQAGFIMADGNIRHIDGNGLLKFIHEPHANLYAVVYHRNHLSVMSAFPLILQNDIYTYDFSSGAAQAYGDINAHKDLGNGIYGMAGGDGDGNGEVQNQDKIEIWAPQSGSSGYLEGDFDMNGQVQNQDKQDILNVNMGRGSQVVTGGPGK